MVKKGRSIAWPIQYIHTYINKTEVVSKSLTIKHVQEKAKLDRLREDDTNGGKREKKGRFKSKIFVNNYISLKFRYMYV